MRRLLYDERFNIDSEIKLCFSWARHDG